MNIRLTSSGQMVTLQLSPVCVCRQRCEQSPQGPPGAGKQRAGDESVEDLDEEGLRISVLSVDST